MTFQHFSTRAAPFDQRLEYWNEVVSSVFRGMVVDGEPSIDAAWSQCALGDVRVASARSQKALVDRWGALGGVGGEGRLLIHLQQDGQSLTCQRGRTAALARGDLTACTADEPYQIHISDQNHMLVVDCPLDRMLERTPELEARLIRRIPGQTPSTRLLRDFLLSLLRQSWNEAAESRDLVALGDVVLTLVERALTGDVAPDLPARSTRERVLAFVTDHVFENDLRTGTIAEALGLSPRTVQDVFAAMATTPTAYINERRLQAAARKLGGAADCGRITDLAFDLGFNDSAYFARVFRARFGLSPAAYMRNRR